MSLLKMKQVSVVPEPSPCDDCGQDMNEAATCNKRFLFFGEGESLARNVSFYGTGKSERCLDCGVWNRKGMIHHFGCCLEQCPRCGGSLSKCDCGWVRNIQRR